MPTVGSAVAPRNVVPGSKPALEPGAQPQRRNGRQGQQDVNHLLGFTLPPRAPPPPSGPRRSAKRTGGGQRFDRSRFVHQFRFIVKPDKDYTAHFADPDVQLDWSDILQVILPTSASALSSVSTAPIVPTCPICLSEPTAPRMTKCGHVFCYPCMLHYLELADGTKFRKCPVCWDAVYAKDLKFVKWHDPLSSLDLAEVSSALFPTTAAAHQHVHQSHQQTGGKLPTEPLKMRLIRRSPISTLALPRSSTWPSDAVPPLRAPWQFTPDAFAYAKFMLGAPDYLRTELETNLRELETEIATLRRWGRQGGTDEELGIVFVRAAMNKVKEQLEKTDALKTSSVMTARKRALREMQEIQELAGKKALGPPLPIVSETSSSEVEGEAEDEGTEGGGGPTVADDAPQEFLAARNDTGGSHLSYTAPSFTPSAPSTPGSGLASTKPARAPRRNVNPAPEPTGDGAYYYYQAASGQNIFLHPLDIKILKSHFGTYSGMPDTIEVLVEGADEGSMNEELRRRCRWLAHLPTASDVVFIEADLSRIVSKGALDPYATALKQRRGKRRDKARREDKAKLKSEQKEQESRPVYTHSAEYESSAYSFPLPSAVQGFYAPPSYGGGVAGAGSSWDEPHAFPLPSTSPHRSTAAPPPPSAQPPTSNGGSNNSASVWSTRSFASALHAASSSSSRHDYHEHDPEFDERWHDFEDQFDGGGRVGGGARGGNSGARGGAGGGGGGGGGKKKKKGLTLNLSGAAMRGTG